jgi:hypothetical protein
MGPDEFFSFGDEEFDDPAGSARPSQPGFSTSGDGTTGLHDVVTAPPPEEGASHSRGDSALSSSEKCTPPPRRARRVAAAVALTLVALLLSRIFAAVHSGSPASNGPVLVSPKAAEANARSSASRRSSRDATHEAASDPALSRRSRPEEPLRRTGGHRHGRKHRPRASRSERSRRDVQPTYEPAYEPPSEAPAPAPVVTPPATEPAPAAGGGIRSGANSPEFGL